MKFFQEKFQMRQLIKPIVFSVLSAGIFLFPGGHITWAAGICPSENAFTPASFFNHRDTPNSSGQAVFTEGVLRSYSPCSPCLCGLYVSSNSEGRLTPAWVFNHRDTEFTEVGLRNCSLRLCGDKKVGEITPEYSHAWGENVGWVNLRPEGAKLEVGGNILAGWIEINTLGWVYLGDGKPGDGYQYSNADAYDYGVNNDGKGDLSGWGWSENVGWVNFDGVKILKEGNFTGYALSDNVGRIKFKSEGPARYIVKTDPYPWKEIGIREEIKAVSGAFPAGTSESIGLCLGSGEFTIPQPGASLDLYLSQREETIEDELVLGFKDNEKRIDFKIDDKTRNARGPPKIEKNNLKIYSDLGAVCNRDIIVHI